MKDVDYSGDEEYCPLDYRNLVLPTSAGTIPSRVKSSSEILIGFLKFYGVLFSPEDQAIDIAQTLSQHALAQKIGSCAEFDPEVYYQAKPF